MTLRAYPRKDGSGWGDFRLPQPEGVGVMWAAVKPTAKLVAMAILMKQVQFAADEGAAVVVSLDDLEAMHLGGRTSIRAGLAELEAAGMLKRDNRTGGRGKAPVYQIAGNPADWLSSEDAVRAGLVEPAKVSPRDTFSSPHDTFSAVKVSPRDTPIKTSNTSTSTTSKRRTSYVSSPATSDVAGDRTERRRRPKERTGVPAANLGEGFSFEQGGESSE